MVDDKIHARARGKVQNLTRQPLEGRGKDGGLRFGEMERDCMVSTAKRHFMVSFAVHMACRSDYGWVQISHGAAHFMKDRLFLNSDPYRVHVCNKCGMVAVADLQKRSFHCTYCRERSVHYESAYSIPTNLPGAISDSFRSLALCMHSQPGDNAVCMQTTVPRAYGYGDHATNDGGKRGLACIFVLAQLIWHKPIEETDEASDILCERYFVLA
jgi:hypothetical protein